MKKLLSKPWVVIVLVLAAVATAGRSLLPTRAASAGARREQAPVGSTEPVRAASAGIETPAAAENEPLRDASVAPISRDPFAPIAKVVGPAPQAQEPGLGTTDTLHLSAIWTQGAATLVLINGRIFQPGDEIGRLRLETATRDGVWVTHAKGRDYLAVGADFTLHTPAPNTLPRPL